MDVLILAIEAGRFGPARLPQALTDAGLMVSALCPADNIVMHSRFLTHRFALPPSRSIRRLAPALDAAIAACAPELIIPGDEQAVVLLQSLVVGRHAGRVSAPARALITRSLGDPRHFDAALLKSDTLRLARRLGIAVPPGRTVVSAADAVAVGDQLGYPVFLKQAFSWAGRGVVRCETSAELRAAFGQRRRAVQWVKSYARRLFGRDWYPAESQRDVQANVAGRPVFYCAFAWEGRMLSGYAGVRLELVSPTGPSVTVQLRAHEYIADVSARMIAALGFTGFIAFDFMEAHGVPLLIECNPRPVPVSHLGGMIGADHAAALANALEGATPPDRAWAPATWLDVTLFPHALDAALARPGRMADIPYDDPGLIDFVTGHACAEALEWRAGAPARRARGRGFPSGAGVPSLAP